MRKPGFLSKEKQTREAKRLAPLPLLLNKITALGDAPQIYEEVQLEQEPDQIVLSGK